MNHSKPVLLPVMSIKFYIIIMPHSWGMLKKPYLEVKHTTTT